MYNKSDAHQTCPHFTFLKIVFSDIHMGSMRIIIIQSHPAIDKICKSQDAAAEIRMPGNSGIQDRYGDSFSGISVAAIYLFSYS